MVRVGNSVNRTSRGAAQVRHRRSSIKPSRAMYSNAVSRRSAGPCRPHAGQVSIATVAIQKSLACEFWNTAHGPAARDAWPDV